jgi:hypothetical protein
MYFKSNIRVLYTQHCSDKVLSLKIAQITAESIAGTLYIVLESDNRNFYFRILHSKHNFH